MSGRDQTDERDLDVKAERSTDYSADQDSTEIQTQPSTASGAESRRAATAVEEKTERSVGSDAERSAGSRSSAEDNDAGGLFPANDTSKFRERWTSIQGRFVDEPTEAVKEADVLVTEVIDRLTRTFAAERDALGGQWSDKEESEESTENLRQAFRKYRDFFDKLLAA